MKIFLCHSSKDKKMISKIKEDLDRKGFETLIDKDFIRHEKLNIEYIEEAIDQSDVLICFLSKASLASKWVSQEWKYALSRQIEKEDIIVTSVLLENVEPPGFLGGRKQYDFSNESTYDSNLSDFVKSIRGDKEEKKNNDKGSDSDSCEVIVLLLIFLLGLWIGRFFPHDSIKKEYYKDYYQPNVIEDYHR